MKRFFRFTLLILISLVTVWGCGSANKNVQIQQPVPPPKPQVAQTSSTDADRVIEEARQHYFTGEREVSLGHLEKAKEEFDASLDVLMQYQANHEPDPKVEAVVNELEDKIFNQEVAALKEGDGFTEHPLENAMIDDLKNIDTFPPPDIQTKNEVEQELKTATYDIPVEVNDTVLSFIRIFQNSRRKEFVGGLVRSGRYLDRMKDIFREEGLPEDLAYTALIESSFKPNAYSHARAKGFWQFISGTAKRYDLQMDWWVDERSDFEKSTRAAARYLKDLHEMFGDWYLALAGYNAGENKIVYALSRTGATNFWDLARTRYIRQETKNYVPAILAGMIIAKDPDKYGFDEDIEHSMKFDTVDVDYAVDLRLVAECTDSSFEEIKLLNPELNRTTTPAKGYTLRIPDGTKDTFLTEIASIPSEKRITWRKHEVRDGDSLTSIAATYHTSVSSIAAVNSLDSNLSLAVGQKIVIPIGKAAPVSSPTSSYASAPGSKKYYSVHSGDTLYRIANKFHVSVDDICSWNGISSKTHLQPGQSLMVKYSEPKTTSVAVNTKNKKLIYQVKRGDTLFQIASNFDTDVESIVRWNKLGSSHAIFPGDRLTIYSK